MLGKLLKYDLKWVYKLIVIYYGLALVFALVGRGFSFLDDIFIFDFISSFSCGVSVAMMFNILINNIIRIWARYTHNVYKDESYLTHTLPVTKSDIFLSKVLTTLITMFTSIIVICISFVICYWSKEFVDFIKVLLPDVSWSIIITTGIVVILEFLFLVFIGLLAITIGYRSNHNKLLKSFVSGFVGYTISSIISLIVLFITGLFNKKILELFTDMNATPSMDILKYILVIAAILYLVYIILCIVIGNKLLQKGVNVD